MEKLIFSGKCLATGEILKGSLIQFEDNTHTIVHKEFNDQKFSSPVEPESVKLENGQIISLEEVAILEKTEKDLLELLAYLKKMNNEISKRKGI